MRKYYRFINSYGLVLLIILIVIFEFFLRKYNWSVKIGYSILFFNGIFFGLLILFAILNNNRYGLFYVLLYSFTNRGLFYIYTPWYRDAPALISTVDVVGKYGFTASSNVFSGIQEWYIRHPALQLIGVLLSKITGIGLTHDFLNLFIIITTILVPFLVYVWTKKLYSGRNIALTATYLVSSINYFMIYPSFSRGMIAIPMMLGLYIILTKNISYDKPLLNQSIILLPLSISLVLAHDLTSLLMIIFVTFVIIYFLKNDKILRQFLLVYIALLFVFCIYDIYVAGTVYDTIRKVLVEESTDKITEIIYRQRDIRQLIVTVSRLLFWLFSGIFILIHFVNERCKFRKIDLVLVSYSLTIGIISIVTIHFLPVRMWLYAHITLVILLSHIIINNRKSESKTLIWKKIRPRKILGIALLLFFMISQILSISPLLVAPFEADKSEYYPCQYRYIWSYSELLASNWVNEYIFPDTIIIGDLGVKVLLQHLPLKTSAYLDNLLSLTEKTTKPFVTTIIFYRLPDMNYVLNGIKHECITTPSDYLLTLIRNYSKLYISGNVILFLI